MTSFLSHLHSELRRARMTRRGATHRPEDVDRFTHKTYPRMPQVPLPEPEDIKNTFKEILTKRTSAVSGNPEATISLQEFGTVLGLSLRARDNGTRNYPSGGALYPVETYLVSTAMETQAPGVFHYNPTRHALERLVDLPHTFDMKTLAAYPEQLPLSTLVVFTSVWRRSSAKYGDFTYTPALLEAGHMSQNILLIGTALGLQVRPYVGFVDKAVAKLLDLDDENEQSIHSVTLCKAAAPRLGTIDVIGE